jgi:MFS family permease
MRSLKQPLLEEDAPATVAHASAVQRHNSAVQWRTPHNGKYWWAVIPFVASAAAPTVPLVSILADLQKMCYGPENVLYIKAGYTAGNYILGFLTSSTLGLLSDHYGRKPILLICGLIMVLPYLFVVVIGATVGNDLGNCPSNPAMTAYISLNVITGVTQAWFGIATAYIADVVPTGPQREKCISYMYMSAVAGLFLGAVIGTQSLCNSPRAFDYFLSHLVLTGLFDWTDYQLFIIMFFLQVSHFITIGSPTIVVLTRTLFTRVSVH